MCLHFMDAKYLILDQHYHYTIFCLLSEHNRTNNKVANIKLTSLNMLNKS